MSNKRVNVAEEDAIDARFRDVVRERGRLHRRSTPRRVGAQAYRVLYELTSMPVELILLIRSYLVQVLVAIEPLYLLPSICPAYIGCNGRLDHCCRLSSSSFDFPANLDLKLQSSSSIQLKTFCESIPRMNNASLSRDLGRALKETHDGRTLFQHRLNPRRYVSVDGRSGEVVDLVMPDKCCLPCDVLPTRGLQRVSASGEWDDDCFCCSSLSEAAVYVVNTRLRRECAIALSTDLHESLREMDFTPTHRLWAYTLPSHQVTCVGPQGLYVSANGKFEIGRSWEETCTDARVNNEGSLVLLELRDDMMEGTDMYVKYEVMDALKGDLLCILSSHIGFRDVFFLSDEIIIQQNPHFTQYEGNEDITGFALSDGVIVGPRVPLVDWRVLLSSGTGLLVLLHTKTREVWVAECKFGDDTLSREQIVED